MTLEDGFYFVRNLQKRRVLEHFIVECKRKMQFLWEIKKKCKNTRNEFTWIWVTAWIVVYTVFACCWVIWGGRFQPYCIQIQIKRMEGKVLTGDRKNHVLHIVTLVQYHLVLSNLEKVSSKFQRKGSESWLVISSRDHLFADLSHCSECCADPLLQRGLSFSLLRNCRSFFSFSRAWSGWCSRLCGGVNHHVVVFIRLLKWTQLQTKIWKGCW